MATNIIQGSNNLPVQRMAVICTDPASPVANDPVRWGRIPGVAETTMDPTTSLTTINPDCIAELSVKGVNSGGNSAVVAGDDIYYQDGDTPKLSKKATSGTLFGVAFGNALSDGGLDTRTGTLVASAGTATIRVLVRK